MRWMLPGVAADLQFPPSRRICAPTLVNIRIFNPQHNKTLAIALMLAD